MTEAIKMPGPPIGYVDMLDIAIHDKQSKTPEKYFPLRPSSGGACGRKLAYELMEYLGHADYKTAAKTPDTVRLLELGSSVEYSVLKNIRMIEDIKLKYKQQVVELFRLKPVGDETEGKLIEGSVDAAMVGVSHPEWKAVMDVKSFKDGFSAAYKTRLDETLADFAAMKSLQKVTDKLFWAENLDALIDELGNDYLTDNLVQINCYLNSDFMVSRGFNHGVVWKHCKNDSREYEIRFAPSKTVFEKVKDKFQRVYQAVLEKKDPEKVSRDSLLGSMRCAFCPYSGTCWNDDALKAWFGTFPKKNWPKDTSRLGKPGKELEELFAGYVTASAEADQATDIEEKILKILVEKKVDKVRLASGHVYEVKALKSPRPHLELRRSKL